MAKAEDLKSKKIEQCSWNPESRVESTEMLFEYAIGQAENATNWYFQKRKKKRLLGFLLRFLALMLTTLAGLIPILNNIFETGDQGLLNPAWVTIAVGVAAFFVGLDKLGGFTSGWVRYIITGQEISRKKEGFQFDWQRFRMQLSDNQTPNAKQLKDAVDRCRIFVMEINGIIQSETQIWASEFQSAIREIDRAVRKLEQESTQGAINVRVVNGDACQQGWVLVLDDGSPRQYTGKNASIIELAPKIHKIHVSGKIGEKAVVAEKSLEIQSGRVTDMELTLE